MKFLLIVQFLQILLLSLPEHKQYSIGTWFNRAVMSSQAFSRQVTALGLASGQKPNEAQTKTLYTWLANGIEHSVPDFIAALGDSIVGAIYHLTDNQWIVPALMSAMTTKDIALIYEQRQYMRQFNDLDQVPQAVEMLVRSAESAVESEEPVLPAFPHQLWNPAPRPGYSGTATFSRLEPLAVRRAWLPRARRGGPGTDPRVRSVLRGQREILYTDGRVETWCYNQFRIWSDACRAS
jgi:hypothetical protein